MGTLSPSSAPLGTLENSTSGSAYSLVAVKGSGGFSTVFTGVCEALPSASLHQRHLQPMSPPPPPPQRCVAVKKTKKPKAAASSDWLSKGDTDDPNLKECDLLRRLTWTTNIYVNQAEPVDSKEVPTSTDLDDQEREIGTGGGVVKLYEVIETEDSLFLVMEYCEFDLFHCITSRGGLPMHIVKDLFTQICNAVEFCHENGLYHRDLKPENVLISASDFSVRLADFGLATDEEWSENFGCGSVRYMSPECLGIPLDTISRNAKPSRPGYSPLKNDVWSLGVILINLIFARNPWHSPKDAFCSTKYLLLQQPALMEEFGLTQEFDQVLRRCFDPNPETRCGVLELRDLVWNIPSFTKDITMDVYDGVLPAVPPPPPTQWGNVKKVYLGIPTNPESEVSFDTNAYGSSAHGQESLLRRLESVSDNFTQSASSQYQQRKKATLSMSVLQKLLVTELGLKLDAPPNTSVSVPEHPPMGMGGGVMGVEMKFGDSVMSSLSTSSGGASESESESSKSSRYDSTVMDPKPITPFARMETRPFAGGITRERSSSLTNNARPSVDQLIRPPTSTMHYPSPIATPIPHLRERAGSLTSDSSPLSFTTSPNYSPTTSLSTTKPPPIRSNLSSVSTTPMGSPNLSTIVSNPLLSPHRILQLQPVSQTTRLHSAPNPPLTHSPLSATSTPPRLGSLPLPRAIRQNSTDQSPPYSDLSSHTHNNNSRLDRTSIASLSNSSIYSFAYEDVYEGNGEAAASSPIVAGVVRGRVRRSSAMPKLNLASLSILEPEEVGPAVVMNSWSNHGLGTEVFGNEEDVISAYGRDEEDATSETETEYSGGAGAFRGAVVRGLGGIGGRGRMKGTYSIKSEEYDGGPGVFGGLNF
ncbi:hypothetical protein HDU98_009448 [Podochytrium sp. JEL0797]|nr:hypothetical protein HDU98_009448 [Podochytrium sp. JEL0797]